MMIVFVLAFLAIASSAQAQLFDDGDGWRRHPARLYRADWRHDERAEYRRPERVEERGWWRPERGEKRWREHEMREGPRRCRAPMHAAGDADARREEARAKAIKSWQEQVINEHGERFINFAAAHVIDEHCDPARVGEGNLLDLKRCVITAAPCLAPREEERREEDRDRPSEERHEEDRR